MNYSVYAALHETFPSICALAWGTCMLYCPGLWDLRFFREMLFVTVRLGKKTLREKANCDSAQKHNTLTTRPWRQLGAWVFWRCGPLRVELCSPYIHSFNNGNAPWGYRGMPLASGAMDAAKVASTQWRMLGLWHFLNRIANTPLIIYQSNTFIV